MKLEQKGEKRVIFGRNQQRKGEKRKKKRGERGSTFSLRSTEIGRSFSDRLRFKVGVLDDSYAWISETPSFAKVARKVQEVKKLQVQELSTGLSGGVAHASRGREPSYSGLFSI